MPLPEPRLRDLPGNLAVRLARRAGLLVTSIPGRLMHPVANPAFSLSKSELRAELARLAGNPVPLARPVIVLSGWRSPAMVSRAIVDRLCHLTSQRHNDFLPFWYPLKGDIEAVATHVREALAKRLTRLGGSPPGEIDIVAHSMGGLVARLIAADENHTPRIARLFTLGTPHRGARLASGITIDAAGRAMRPGSAFLASLDERLTHARFELFPYAHLRDRWVGARHSAPPERTPIWTGGTRFFSHFSVTEDRLILADIARRLRGEPALAHPDQPEPPTN